MNRVLCKITSAIFFIFIFFLLSVKAFRLGSGIGIGLAAETYKKSEPMNPKTEELSNKELQKEVMKLFNRLQSHTPKNNYLVINTVRNEFRIYRGNELLRQGLCSTGSYIILDQHGIRKWIFKTPQGEFRIQSKTENPVWKKPDWAFVEEGLPVPPSTHASRFEYGVLGEYALGLGSGYLIHGTLYKRFLGLPVTHGCIRMNDEDLAFVYRKLQIGSKVYIY